MKNTKHETDLRTARGRLPGYLVEPEPKPTLYAVPGLDPNADRPLPGAKGS